MHLAELLRPIEREVLVLLSAHGQVTNSSAARRTTLEAYARLGASQGSPWAADIAAGGLRRAVAEALQNLRAGSLVRLDDDGFHLTSDGESVVEMLERDQEVDEEAAEALSSIRTLRNRWMAEAS